jgi:hypothetical protein
MPRPPAPNMPPAFQSEPYPAPDWAPSYEPSPRRKPGPPPDMPPVGGDSTSGTEEFSAPPLEDLLVAAEEAERQGFGVEPPGVGVLEPDVERDAVTYPRPDPAQVAREAAEGKQRQ